MQRKGGGRRKPFLGKDRPFSLGACDVIVGMGFLADNSATIGLHDEIILPWSGSPESEESGPDTSPAHLTCEQKTKGQIGERKEACP